MTFQWNSIGIPYDWPGSAVLVAVESRSWKCRPALLLVGVVVLALETGRIVEDEHEGDEEHEDPRLTRTQLYPSAAFLYCPVEDIERACVRLLPE
jgi:hypothetical protein